MIFSNLWVCTGMNAMRFRNDTVFEIDDLQAHLHVGFLPMFI